MEKRVLLFIKLPPPLTGATLMNQYVCESNFLRKEFKTRTISISYKTQIENNRIFSIRKFIIIIGIWFRLIYNLIIFKPKIIYFQISPLGAAFYRDCVYVLIIKVFQKHIVYHMHGKGINEYVANSNVKKKIYRWVFNKSSVICLAECLTPDLLEIYKKRPFIVNNAIANVYPIQLKDKQKRSTLNILFLSNLIVSKGVYNFLDAIELINEKHKGKFTAILIGREVEIAKEQLLNAIKTRGIDDSVIYLGPKYNVEKNKIISETDILVYPTLKDVWGLVILEAMQYGIPVIATREGAIPEIINDGYTGFIVDKNNPKQIASKLEILINDSELRKRMGEAGRKKFLEKYTLETFEQNMKKVFDSVFENILKE